MTQKNQSCSRQPPTYISSLALQTQWFQVTITLPPPPTAEQLCGLTLSRCQLPAPLTPHPTLPVDGRLLFFQRADCDQTPSPASRLQTVVCRPLSVYTVIKGKPLSPLQGSYQPSRETSTGRLSLATGNITLRPTLHIMSKCCAWTESGPKNVPGPNRSNVGPARSSTGTWIGPNPSFEQG